MIITAVSQQLHFWLVADSDFVGLNSIGCTVVGVIKFN